MTSTTIHEWLESVLPGDFVRTVWDSLSRRRFVQLVVAALDGTPLPRRSGPVAFFLGSLLLCFALFKSFPLIGSTNDIVGVLDALPAVERTELLKATGIDTLTGVSVPSVGRVRLDDATHRTVTRYLRTRMRLRWGVIGGESIVGLLEQTGHSDLALRVRADLAHERRLPIGEPGVLLLVLCAFIPAWALSHALLGARDRTLRVTRDVHMYNDGWLLLFAAVPLYLSYVTSRALNPRWPAYALSALAGVAVLVWLARTPGLYRLTHGASAWRVASAHVLGLIAGLALVFPVFFVLGAAHAFIANVQHLR